MKKGISKKKKCARYFWIRKYAFLIIQKRISKKPVPGILRFVGMLFNEIIFSVNGGYRDSWGLYAFLIFNIKEVMRIFGVCKYPF